MADGGTHFRNEEVTQFCEENSIEHITTPAYAPWTNGLIENSNKILLGRLKRFCAPDIDTTDYEDIDVDSIPYNWPEHLDEAIRSMNDRILPALGFTPRELLWGMQTKGTKESLQEAIGRNEAEQHFTFTD
ncbi:hypothetical protein M422DRAFT_141881, partial [Sphaerobolus stellatus SS14]